MSSTYLSMTASWGPRSPPRSDINIRNRRGPRTVPWGTPERTLAQAEVPVLTLTAWSLSRGKEPIHLPRGPEIPNFLSLRSSRPWSTL